MRCEHEITLAWRGVCDGGWELGITLAVSPRYLYLQVSFSTLSKISSSIHYLEISSYLMERVYNNINHVSFIHLPPSSTISKITSYCVEGLRPRSWAEPPQTSPPSELAPTSTWNINFGSMCFWKSNASCVLCGDFKSLPPPSHLPALVETGPWDVFKDELFDQI